MNTPRRTPPARTAAVRIEFLKAWRSRVPLVMAGVFTVLPLAGALFIFIAADPQRARDLGLLRAKAELTGITADWSGLLAFATQLTTIGTMLVFSFLLAWLFGREFDDRTAHYLMALPVTRRGIVMAKYVVYGVWGLLLTIWLTLVTWIVGLAMRLPEWSTQSGLDTLGAMGRVCLLTLLAMTPLGYLASRSRGYLAPLAMGMALLVLAQLAAVLGWGAALPWSIPAISAGLVPDQAAGPGSWVIVLATGVSGCWATVRWWQSADAGL